MAKTIYLNDGSTEVILDDSLLCFKRIVYEKLGRDAENMFDGIIEDLTEEPDGEDWERIADGYRNRLIEVMNELQEIVYANRLNRKRLEEIYKGLDRDL